MSEIGILEKRGVMQHGWIILEAILSPDNIKGQFVIFQKYGVKFIIV